ncbi:MAG: hypothetical protein WA021_03155 [Minisyncoccia bacterium]
MKILPWVALAFYKMRVSWLEMKSDVIFYKIGSAKTYSSVHELGAQMSAIGSKIRSCELKISGLRQHIAA